MVEGGKFYGTSPINKRNVIFQNHYYLVAKYDLKNFNTGTCNFDDCLPGSAKLSEFSFPLLGSCFLESVSFH